MNKFIRTIIIVGIICSGIILGIDNYTKTNIYTEDTNIVENQIVKYDK